MVGNDFCINRFLISIQINWIRLNIYFNGQLLNTFEAMAVIANLCW